MEKLSSCQNHEKNVMVRLPRDFTKIIKKGLLKEKINKRSIPSIDFVAPNDLMQIPWKMQRDWKWGEK